MSAASRKPQVPVPSAPVTPAAVVEAPAPAEEEKLQEIVGEVAQEVIPSVAEQQEEAPLPVAPVVAPVAPVAPAAPAAPVASEEATNASEAKIFAVLDAMGIGHVATGEA